MLVAVLTTSDIKTRSLLAKDLKAGQFKAGLQAFRRRAAGDATRFELRGTTVCAATLTLLLAVAGCGGGDNGGTGGSASGERAAAVDDPCTLLTVGDAEKALGSAPGAPVRQENAALESCQYLAEPSDDGLEAVAGAGSASVSIFRTDTSDETFDSNTAGGKPVSGVGDKAAELGTAVYFLKGERMYAVDLSGDGISGAARVELAKQIAGRV